MAIGCAPPLFARFLSLEKAPIFVQLILPQQAHRVAQFKAQVASLQHAFSEHTGYMAFTVGFHFFQCLLFVNRSYDNGVSSSYFAVEFLGIVILSVSIFVSWAHAAIGGIDDFLEFSFRTLLLDVFVMSSVFCICLAPPDSGKTWFSFNLLASIRALKHWRKFRLFANFNTYNRKWTVLHNVILASAWCFFASTVIMVLESLGAPTDLDWTRRGPTDALFEDQYVNGFKKQRWTFVATVYFLFSTASTVGYGDYFPVSTLGQWLTMILIAGGIGSFSMTVHQLVQVYRRNPLGSGEYIPKKKARHVVVAGPLSGQGFKDFLEEIFHPDREAYAVDLNLVVLAPEIRLLQIYQRIISRRAYIRLRDKVWIIGGSAMNAHDRIRTRMHSAETVLVMPDLFASDMRIDDSETVIRTLAVRDAIPFTRVMCVLHQAENRPLLVAAGVSSTDIVCIDEFKMSLLGKACEIPAGIPALICNLCKAMGDIENPEAARWQQEYDRGLGHELYEAPLSDAYCGGTFSDAVVDILHRSTTHDVYLIGLVAYIEGERVVYMHPGHKFNLRADVEFMGVFLAPSLESIKQQSGINRKTLMVHRESTRFIGQASEDPESSIKRPSELRAAATEEVDVRQPETSGSSHVFSPSAKQSIMKETLKSTMQGSTLRSSKRESQDLSMLNSTMQNTTMNATMKSKSSTRHVLGAEVAKFRDLKDPDGQMEVMSDAYMRGIGQIGRNLLTRGVRLDTVVRITNEFQALQKMKGPSIGKVSKDDRQQSGQPMPAALEAMMGDDGTMPDTLDVSKLYEDKAALWDSPQMKHLKWLHGIHKKALQTLAPNKRLRDEGGHVLICILGPHVEPGNPLPPSMNLYFGLEHFVRPLRSSKIVNPKIVVLAPAKPKDWNAVVEFGEVYLVEGSPLNLFDLDRAGFRKANSIVITRGMNIAPAADVHTADAEAIFATRLIEANLPKTSLCQVILELVFDQNYIFVPLGRLALTAPIVPKDITKSADEQQTDALAPGSKGTPAGGILGMMTVRANSRSGRPTLKDTAIQMESSEYYRQARFASGQLFTPSIVTSFAASALCNPSLTSLIRSLLSANMLMVPVPNDWETRTYGDLFVWCLREKNILALGLWRAGKSSASGQQERKESGDSGPVKHNYIFVAPSAVETRVLRSDRLLCLVPSL